MNDIKFFVYINEQSTKPLVHSLSDAIRYASRNMEYKPALRIECYFMLFKISEWYYDYHAKEWVQQIVTSSESLHAKLG